MTKMQESDGHLQRRHGAPLCGAFSFAAGAVDGDKEGAALRREEKKKFSVLRFSGQDRRFCAFPTVFGVFRGEMSDGARGGVEKIGENAKIRSFRAFFTTLRFC